MRKGNREANRPSQRASLEPLESRLLLSISALDAPYLPPQHELYVPNGYLTASSTDAPLSIVQSFLSVHADELGLGQQDLSHFVVTDEYSDADTGTTHIYLRQTLNGLEVANANLVASVVKDGRLLNVAGGFVSGLTAAAALAATSISVMPSLSAAQALVSVASALGLTPSVQSLVVNTLTAGSQQVSTFSDANLSLDPIPSKLQYVATQDGIKLAWDFVMRTPDQEHWYNVSVDAASGTMVDAHDWVDHASYKVFALPTENPDDGSRTTVTDPNDTTASPYGWHDTNAVAGAEYTDTRGNNVFAQEDTDHNNTGGFRPDGGAGLTFDFPLDLAKSPSNYQAAAITNLFYWNNLLHDINYRYGFTEAAGNFQQNDYGRGGTGGDPVQADAQDGSGTNNANFATPPDGSSPRMQMYNFTATSPNRDGDLDSMIIVHEYGHGVSNRLVGGPSNTNAMDAIQSGGMGEGYSDWWALMLTQKSGDTKMGSYPIGTYVEGQSPTGSGMRRAPYSFDKTVDPRTYGDYNLSQEVHNSGEIWASALWDMTWLLIDRYGYSTNIAGGYTGGGSDGNVLALKLVMDSLKLLPANPTFLQGRDAILQADQVLTGGANSNTIWAAFARRGMGFSATDGGGANATTVVESFDLPGNHRPELTNPTISPLSGSAGDTYTFTVHYYDQDGDAPLFYNGEHYSKLYLSGGRVEEMSLVSGSPANGTYRVAVSGLSAGSYQHFFSFVDARGLDQVLGWREGPYVSVPTGSDLLVDDQVWDDGPYSPGVDNQHSDDDGYAEAGEAVNVKIRLRNTAGADLSSVHAYLSSSNGSVIITASDVFYGTIAGGDRSWGGGKDYMFLDFSSTTSVPFSLHVTYQKSGVDYVQDISFSNTFYADGVLSPNIVVDHIAVDDSLGGDGDGIPESGESIDFDIYLRNSGNADAFEVKAHISDLKGTGFVGKPDQSWQDYLDLLAGGAAQRQLIHRYDTNDTPMSFAGWLTADITIQAAGGHEWVYNDCALFEVQADPWVRVDPLAWDFGTSGTDVDVSKTVTIRNVGAENLVVTGLTTSHGDTTIGEPLPTPSTPWVIPAGGSRTFAAIIETSALQGQRITRQVVVTSNGRLWNITPPSDRVTITGLVSDMPPAFQVPDAQASGGNCGMDVSGDWIVWVDTKNGNPDIYGSNVRTGQTLPICTNSANQYDPKVSGNIVAWSDSRNWNGVGDITYDVYAYSLSTGQEFAVSTNSQDERAVGVDGNRVAFTRVFHVWTEGSNYGSNPRNLLYYDVGTGQEVAVTNYTYNGHNPLSTVTSNIEPQIDFGGGVLAWQERRLTWDGSWWVIAGGSLKKMQIGSDPSPVELLASSVDYGPAVTNGGKVVWSKLTGSYIQVWLWESGSSARQLTTDSYDHSDHYGNLAAGSDVVVYDHRRQDGLFAFDLATSAESQVTLMQVQDSAGTRMDGHLVIWQSGGVVCYAFLKEPDLSISSADITFSNDSPVEGGTIDVSVLVHNLTTIAVTGDVTVRLYDGDPDAGGTQLGSDRVISGGIGSRGQATATFTGIPVGIDGTHHIYALVLPAGSENPGNNKTSKDLTVLDSDTAGPAITGLVIAEFNGDGDGIIGADEQMQISWSLADPSGIASTTLSVDGTAITPINGLGSGNPTSASCYAILGPLGATSHSYVITATDADTSPAISQYTGGFAVATAEEITALLDAVALTDGQATPINFGAVVRNSPAIERIFFVRNDGEQTLSLGAISVPAGFTVTAPASSVLAPGDSTYFTVTLQTGAVDTFSGQVSLANSDGPRSPDGLDENPFNFPISGTVNPVPPEISVFLGQLPVLDGQVSPIDVDSAQQGSPEPSIEFTIRNDGDLPLTLTTPFADLAHFIVGEPSKTTLNAGETTTFMVTLKTDAVWTGSETVSFANNDSDENPFDFVVSGSVQAPAQIVGRRIFYNRSYFDGNGPEANAADDAAIATDKQALLPGQTATFANYTSYSRGINGIMVDIAGLANPGGLSASDFIFRVGNSNDPSAWSVAPAPINDIGAGIRLGAGLSGSDRVTIIWADNAIQKQWLQVTVLANGNTGLADEDVFCFGNAIGETGNSVGDASVTQADELGARNHPAFLPPATITNVYDFDHNRLVNAADQIIARNNPTTTDALALITVLAGGSGGAMMATSPAPEPLVVVGDLGPVSQEQGTAGQDGSAPIEVEIVTGPMVPGALPRLALALGALVRWKDSVSSREPMLPAGPRKVVLEAPDPSLSAKADLGPSAPTASLLRAPEVQKPLLWFRADLDQAKECRPRGSDSLWPWTPWQNALTDDDWPIDLLCAVEGGRTHV